MKMYFKTLTTILLLSLLFQVGWGKKDNVDEGVYKAFGLELVAFDKYEL